MPNSIKKFIATTVGISAFVLSSSVMAQSNGLSSTIVTKADVSVAGREAVMARVEVAPGAVAAWHTHPGDEMSYVIEGETDLMVAGQPTQLIKTGAGFLIPAGLVHSAKNTGNVTARLAGVYVVEKGKSLASLAAAPAA